MQQQARRGEPLHQGLDRNLAIDESRQIHCRLQWRDRGTRAPWKDPRTHDASQVIIAMVSMRESLPARAFSQQCRKS
jgi:hypothetical protein